jgi:16S rRNA (adenine1518-N6/adenine1519-N6)-dimethyltransferase
LSHRPRKRFGQNFLVDEAVLERIAAAIRPTEGDLLLEIGPGPGALTACLAGTVGRYLAVEIDRDLIPFLKARFDDVTVVNADILRVDLDELLGDERWRVVGNLPYNISSPLLVRLLEHLGQIRDMHFMLQREVAARLAAVPRTKAWGRLGVLIQYHCEVELLFEVAPESFEPPPRVWSAVVRITPRAAPLALASEAALSTVLRHGFSQRRKRLSNALQSLDLDWAQAGVDPGMRADELSVAQFVALANALRG